MYVREDIPSRKLKICNTTEDIESILIEANLTKTKCLFCGCYRPPSQSDQYFFENIGKVHKYSKHYDKFMLVCDFNAEESEPYLSQFRYGYNSAKNIVKESTCFKNVLNPSCIDLFITNNPLSFQSTIAVTNGLSDFHKIVMS